MDEDWQSGPALPDTLSSYELLILYTSEAYEWATYLQQILKSTKKFPKKSILLYSVSPADQLHGYNFDSLQNCKCVVVLFTGAFLDNLSSLDLQAALQRVLCPPHRVVALLCGVDDDHVLTECFPDWPYWRKLYTEDEPAVYVSTILESVTESRMREVKDKSVDHVTAASPTQQSTRTEEEVLDEEEEREETQERGGQAEREEGQSNTEETGATDLSCLTVQPNRIHCGDQETVFIIFKYKIDHYSEMEIEFSSESGDSTRIQPTVENSFTLSVTAPDFPAGVASLTLRTKQSSAILKPVTYFTSMGEVNHFIENATDPVNFICQAFHLQSNSRESLDHMLTECLKSKMPATGLQLFGIRQIEEDNMASYQRNEELPTLLHFAAKYGLKKLTTALLQCPGALQAYSVMNKNGDYPNTLAQKSGFSDLRQFMDEFVETADMLKSHIEETIAPEEEGDVYERMTTASQDMLMRFSGQSEDIYESMLEISPECAEDLYEVMNAVEENPEEAMLRTFFQAKPQMAEDPHTPSQSFVSEERENLQPTETDRIEEEEEDPYNLTDQIYDTVDPETMYPSIINRPPAPVPRPQPEPSRDQDKPEAYISRVFSEKNLTQVKQEFQDKMYATARPPSLNQGSVYDPYAGMKTPGQRQLISLQERVKVGEISVEEAVQEFKAWQFDHERRAHSIRYQQENLKKLRDSITRRHKEKEKIGQTDYEISAPLQTNLYWASAATMECGVYEPTPRLCTMPPPTVPSAAATGNVIKRGSWKTGSTSSTSSTESNRLSTHSTMSYSSGTEPELEDSLESLPVPPRPPRLSEPTSMAPAPRIPPRIPERVPEKMLHERYTSCPTRALPQVPQRQSEVAPPVPRRQR
ncbi:phosphoinositide 3-kinase adapter protein 1 [Periophthalmus magnuspinnatus]|uniref:phosphoinositide 3-kinase adapter protein 1 n=1 Tax=Periophthalmus magnuspinnatus TaxID=409849 RepID=UPI00145AF617|nr:phosphoinositide 3-kinase adapter protein 1 [Periophthalmus magnuspinnatus]